MPHKAASVKAIPDIVVGRLPFYLRTLRVLAAEGMEITSSLELGKRLGLTSAQIRKDLSYFGEFGKQGLGYNIPFLIGQLRRILKVDRAWGVVLVGVGDLGRAIAHYHGFHDRGFEIRIVFDNDPGKIGKNLAGHTVEDMETMVDRVREAGIRIAMLAVPATAAQRVTNLLVKADVKAILNYAPITLGVPKGIQVQNIDPAAHLQHMTYYLEA
ncbi:MAG: redox-sensing transcriptional repressor Rex [Anaerolineales bacterium]|nr:redox-sensing transcriptional repressor Rex [Anaerolineales bacterium]